MDIMEIASPTEYVLPTSAALATQASVEVYIHIYLQQSYFYTSTWITKTVIRLRTEKKG